MREVAGEGGECAQFEACISVTSPGVGRCQGYKAIGRHPVPDVESWAPQTDRGVHSTYPFFAGHLSCIATRVLLPFCSGCETRVPIVFSSIT